MKIKYSLILPCYNEYGNLKLLIPKILKSFRKANHQIVIVDDNSEDNTFLKIKRDFKKHKRIKYILRKTNRGLAKSIKDGIIKSKGENIIVMDSDFNHRPEDLKFMITYFEKKKLDLLCGSRFLKNGSSNTFFRHICSLIFNKFINFLTKGKLSDNLSGFFIIKRKFIKKDINKVFYGYGEFYIRLLFYMQRKKIIIDEVPVKYGLRKYGQSKSRLVRMLILYTFETLKLLKSR